MKLKKNLCTIFQTTKGYARTKFKLIIQKLTVLLHRVPQRTATCEADQEDPPQHQAGAPSPLQLRLVVEVPDSRPLPGRTRHLAITQYRTVIGYTRSHIGNKWTSITYKNRSRTLTTFEIGNQPLITFENWSFVWRFIMLFDHFYCKQNTINSALL